MLIFYLLIILAQQFINFEDADPESCQLPCQHVCWFHMINVLRINNNITWKTTCNIRYRSIYMLYVCKQNITEKIQHLETWSILYIYYIYKYIYTRHAINMHLKFQPPSDYRPWPPCHPPSPRNHVAHPAILWLLWPNGSTMINGPGRILSAVLVRSFTRK